MIRIFKRQGFHIACTIDILIFPTAPLEHLPPPGRTVHTWQLIQSRRQLVHVLQGIFKDKREFLFLPGEYEVWPVVPSNDENNDDANDTTNYISEFIQREKLYYFSADEDTAAVLFVSRGDFNTPFGGIVLTSPPSSTMSQPWLLASAMAKASSMEHGIDRFYVYSPPSPKNITTTTTTQGCSSTAPLPSQDVEKRSFVVLQKPLSID